MGEGPGNHMDTQEWEDSVQLSPGGDVLDVVRAEEAQWWGQIM